MLKYIFYVAVVFNLAHTSDITASINEIGFELLKYTPVTKNVMISPFSINTAMAMLTVGTNDNTKDQLYKAFNWPYDTMMISYKALIDQIDSKSTVYNLSSSNRIYIDNGFDVKPEYIDLLDSYFVADTEKVNFCEGDNSATVNLINNWVAEKTNYKIKNLFDFIANSVQAIIINTIYFKANWMHPFTAHKTVDELFYIDKQHAVKTKTMKLTEYLGYYKNNKIEMIKLPYNVMGDANDDEFRQISLVVIKPIKRGELEFVEKDFINYKFTEINTWMSNLKYDKKIALSFPKFQFKAGMDNLVSVLSENFGVTDLFGDNANLSGISDTQNLTVSKIIHQAYIAVDENGTEAAAVTAVLIDTTSIDVDEPQVVLINQPFMFLIYDETNKVVLFYGRLVIPDENLLNSKFVERDFKSSNSIKVYHVYAIFLCYILPAIIYSCH